MQNFEDFLDSIKRQDEDTELAFKAICVILMLTFGLLLALYIGE